jgi:hypothetical protein
VAIDPDGGAVAAWSRFDGTTARVQAALLEPGTTAFGAPVTLSAAGGNATDPQVALDAAGNAVVLWSRFDGSVNRIQATFRPTGGSFGATQTVSASGQSAVFPRLAVNPAGNAVAVWQRFDGADQRVQAAFRPAGGGFGGVQTISVAGQDGTAPDVAIDAAGRAVAIWQRFDGSDQRVQAASRAATGSFGAPQTLSAAGQDSVDPDIAVGAAGAAVASWQRFDGSVQRVQVSVRPLGGSFAAPQTVSPAGLQALDPRVGAAADGAAIVVWQQVQGGRFEIDTSRRPAGGQFGAAARISEAGTGALSPDLAFDAEGDALAGWHRFANNEFEVQTADWTLSGVPPPRRQGEPVPPFDFTAPPSASLADTIAPVVRRFSVTRRFAAGRRSTRLRAAAVRRGGRIRYRLSEPASVSITLSRLAPARAALALPLRKPVVLRRRGRAGANAISFSGRVRHRPLLPGRWRATIRAKDSAGNRSKPRRATFRIVRRPAR